MEDYLYLRKHIRVIMRKASRDILGYLLGLVLFVGLMPALMWLASGRLAFWAEVAIKDMVAWGLMLCGLLLSIWTIVYMKLRGKGNPMDAFGHDSEERRLHRDFGNEYDAYCHHTRRF